MATANARNAHNFILSATAPETIDIAVATKTTWKKKSDAPEYTEPPSNPSSAESDSTCAIAASSIWATVVTPDRK